MDSAQLQELFDELNAALVMYARQWCESPDDAVQEAFIDLSNIHPDPASPKAWLYTTTRRKAQNIARADNRRRHHYQQAFENNLGNSTTDDWFCQNDSAALLTEDVQRGLEALHGDQREVVVARLWGELSFEQLAELLDCSVSSAHRRYMAALGRLKSILSTDVEDGSRLAVSALDKLDKSDAQLNGGSDAGTPRRTDSANGAYPIAKLSAQVRLADGEA